MKKYVIFSVVSILLFGMFTSTLYFEGGSAVSSFLKAHKFYVLAFFGLSLTYMIISWYKKRQKCKNQSVQLNAAASARFKANAKRSKKFNRWMTVAFTLFLCLMSMLQFLHLGEKNYILLVASLTIFYMGITAFLNFNNYKNYKLQMEKAKQAEETLTLKLRSIRSQLNPHFMFNALTSIQNLMNKNDIPAANHYLSMFADLTRKVLNTSDQDLISLEDELKIQDDYLQMEQLRFGFQYEVKVNENINLANTEIPAMLLQPFVENAVKHGVGMLQRNGMITLHIDKQGHDLLLSVTDNGKGFDKNTIRQKTESLGLKLSEERIALLNQVHPEQPLTLTIDSDAKGTCITITLLFLLS